MTNTLSKLSPKKVIYTLSGLAVILLFSLFIENLVHANAKEGKKFGEWVVACNKNDKKNKTCFLSFTLSSKSKDSKNEQFVANFKMGYFGKDKKLQMEQVLPFGINLPAGTTLVANKEAVARGTFLTCEAFGCIALTDLKDSDIATLEKDNGAFIGLFSSNGKQINFPLPTKGMKEGLAALKQ